MRTLYSGSPLIRPPSGQKKLAVLTGWPFNEGFFYKKMYGSFFQAAKKSDHNNEVAVRRGSTVTTWERLVSLLNSD